MDCTSDDLMWKTLAKSYEDVASTLGVLANKRRLQMLISLMRGPQTFKDLQELTGHGKTALAHHLGLLVKSGILKRIDKGRYELSHDGVDFLTAVGAAYANSRRRREHETAKRVDYIRKIHTKEKEMKEFEVKIVKLEPMRVASVRAISQTPEHDAWEKMRAWAEPKGLLEDLEKHPVFGFNNPPPSPDREGYGYEFWIRVGPDTKPEGDIKIKEFEGGLYAVTTCKLKEELESDFFQTQGYFESWKRIADWVKCSKYRSGKQQCLEKAHDPKVSDEELTLDLYISIEEESDEETSNDQR